VVNSEKDEGRRESTDELLKGNGSATHLIVLICSGRKQMLNNSEVIAAGSCVQGSEAATGGQVNLTLCLKQALNDVQETPGGSPVQGSGTRKGLYSRIATLLQ
jgi:hypothetical protein